MSSPLSGMTCLRVEDRTCWIRIEPDQALTLPYSDTFALATLLEVFVGLVNFGAQTLWERDINGPLRGAIEAETGLPYKDTISRLCDDPRATAPLAARYVSFRGYRDVTGFTVPVALHPDASGLYVATRWWTDERERQEAHGLVSAELAAWAEQDYAHRQEGGPPPSLTQPAATMVIEATSPDWLAHLRPGMVWDGYCFADEAPAFP
jgi:hypothetical protein